MNKMTPLAENLLKKSTGFRNKADLYQATRFLHEIGMYCLYRLLGNFCAFSADFCFPKSNSSKHFFRNTIRVSTSLKSDQAGHFVRPDLGPN